MSASHNCAAIACAASADVRTGTIANEPRSFQFSIHTAERDGSSVRSGTAVLGAISLALVGNASLLLTPPSIYTRAATREAICLPAIVDELVVSTASPRGKDSRTYRSPILAGLYEIGQAEVHRSKVPNLYREMRNDGAKPEVSASVPTLLVSLRSPSFLAKKLLEQPCRFFQAFLGENH